VIPIPGVKPRVVAVRNTTPHPTGDRERVRYRIRPGDTLSAIAEEHGTTVSRLQSWNGLASTRITAGSWLTIYSYRDTSHD